MDLDQPTVIEQADLGIGMDVDMDMGLDGDRYGDPVFNDVLGDVSMDVPLEPNDVGIPLSPMALVSISSTCLLVLMDPATDCSS